MANEQLSIRKIDNEVFVYDSEKAFIHSFNGTGAFIWNQLESGIDTEQIVDGVITAFKVEPSVAKQDVYEFVNQLADANLIHCRNEHVL